MTTTTLPARLTHPRQAPPAGAEHPCPQTTALDPAGLARQPGNQSGAEPQNPNNPGHHCPPDTRARTRTSTSHHDRLDIPRPFMDDTGRLPPGDAQAQPLESDVVRRATASVDIGLLVCAEPDRAAAANRTNPFAPGPLALEAVLWRQWSRPARRVLTRPRGGRGGADARTVPRSRSQRWPERRCRGPARCVLVRDEQHGRDPGPPSAGLGQCIASPYPASFGGTPGAARHAQEFAGARRMGCG